MVKTAFTVACCAMIAASVSAADADATSDATTSDYKISDF